MNFLYASVIGLLSGLIGSLGLGGGAILLVYLTAFLGYNQLTAQGMNLIFFIPIAIISIFIHKKSGLVDLKFAFKSMITGTLGVLLGCYLAHAIPELWLSKAFGVLLLLLGLKELFHKKQEDVAEENKQIK